MPPGLTSAYPSAKRCPQCGGYRTTDSCGQPCLHGSWKCLKCGSSARQPGSGGRRIHRFELDEEVVSSAGMRGVVILVPYTPRIAKHVGYKIRWENGFESYVRAPDLDHAKEEA